MDANTPVTPVDPTQMLPLNTNDLLFKIGELTMTLAQRDAHIARLTQALTDALSERQGADTTADG